MIFLLLSLSLLQILELHFSNVSLLENKIHRNVIECRNLLFDGNYFYSGDIFEQMVCLHNISKVTIDCSSDQIFHVLNQVVSFPGSGLEAMPNETIPEIVPGLI